MLFIRGGQALPVSKYIEMKLLSQEVEDVVLLLFRCSQPRTLSFHPNQVLTDPGASTGSFFASKSLPERNMLNMCQVLYLHLLAPASQLP